MRYQYDLVTDVNKIQLYADLEKASKLGWRVVNMGTHPMSNRYWVLFEKDIAPAIIGENPYPYPSISGDSI